MTDAERAALWAKIRDEAKGDDAPIAVLDALQDVHELLARIARGVEALTERKG